MKRAAIAFALLFASRAYANQLTVDARTLRMNDMATVTLSLEGSFAEVEAASPPLENLAIVGEPWGKDGAGSIEVSIGARLTQHGARTRGDRLGGRM